jgi:hypothetical protein
MADIEDKRSMADGGGAVTRNAHLTKRLVSGAMMLLGVRRGSSLGVANGTSPVSTVSRKTRVGLALLRLPSGFQAGRLDSSGLHARTAARVSGHPRSHYEELECSRVAGGPNGGRPTLSAAPRDANCGLRGTSGTRAGRPSLPLPSEARPFHHPISMGGRGGCR